MPRMTKAATHAQRFLDSIAHLPTTEQATWIIAALRLRNVMDYKDGEYFNTHSVSVDVLNAKLDELILGL